LFDAGLQKQISGIASSESPAKVPAIAVAMWWNDAKALDAARAIVADPKADAGARSQLLKSLAERNDPANFKTFAAFITDEGAPLRLRKEAVDALGSSGDRQAVVALIAAYPKLSPELKPAVINALSRDPDAASAMLDAVEAKTIPVGDVNPNQVRQINGFGDKALADRVTKLVGTVKTERDPARVQVVEKMRETLRHHSGDEIAGQAVFTRICAQCHTIYGKGGSVGPDLTGVGRENLDAILTNVLDPNLVIGASYFVNIAKMKNGTVASGVLVEESDTRIVLKDGTKTYTLNRANVKELAQQKVSMMPEGLENTMSEQDFANLVAFLLTREAPAATQPSR
jgi:putative heme-binding domain-containing protein